MNFEEKVRRERRKEHTGLWLDPFQDTERLARISTEANILRPGIG